MRTLDNLAFDNRYGRLPPGFYSEIDRLLALLRRPFDEQPDMAAYAAPPPDWAQHIEVSCSS